MIKSRRMRWAGHGMEWERRGTCIDYLWENQRERDYKEDQDVDVWITLKCVL
jgi:hypothetical protein